MGKILVIEDDPSLRGSLVEWLSFEEYQVVEAADGIEGVAQAFLHQPDLIVCDINMPRLDGYGVLLEIQANSATQLKPFIFLTAKGTPEDFRAGMSLGADDYVTKPFDHEDFLKAIEARLAKKAIQDEKSNTDLATVQDVLSQERDQRLLQTKLVSMFSQDFRMPVTTISTSVSMIKEFADMLDPARRLAHLDRIDASAKRLSRMLDSMYLVAQLESGRFKLQPESIEIDSFVSQMITEFQLMYGKAYKLHFESSLSENVEVDPNLLRLVLDNLISNASKFSQINTNIYLRLNNQGEFYQLSIQDQGRGIAESDLETIFDPFKRGRSSDQISGSGLGLVITKHALELQGGEIQVTSQQGKGTTFVIKLPKVIPDELKQQLHPAPQLAPAYDEKAPSQPNKTLPKAMSVTTPTAEAPDDFIRVLLIGDFEVMREGLKLTINNQTGMRVVAETADKAKAIQLTQELNPDVILIELHRPTLESVDVIRDVKGSFSTANVLVLTDSREEQVVLAAIKAGALGYLLKDASKDELFDAIRAVSRGESSLPPTIARMLVAEISQPPALPPTDFPLTAREMETLRLVAQGLTNEEIADTLVLSERTVRNYVTNILSKLHLANRVQAALYALREGIIE